MSNVQYIVSAEDVMHVLLHLRQDDIVEATVSLGEFDIQTIFSAIFDTGEDHNYIVYADDGEPIALFGVVEKMYATPLGWALGTDRWPSAIRVMNHTIKNVILPDLEDKGCTGATCFSMAGREGSEKWLASLGIKNEGMVDGVKHPKGLIQWSWTAGKEITEGERVH